MLALPRMVTCSLVFVMVMAASAQMQPASVSISLNTVVLHAAHMLDVEKGSLVSPGEILVQGDRIIAAGTAVARPSGARVIDLGDRTLIPGLIDAHVHLFLHPGAEDSQTVTESTPQRTILAVLAAKADLEAGFTAERDMGTEGAGSADTAVRDAINEGLIPGPRLRVSGNAISITGGHEDALHYNPSEHISSNATYADSPEDLIRVMRAQMKEGADFTKIYETGADRLVDGRLHAPYQYSEAELKAAVEEAARMGTRVAVHCTAEPGARYAVEAGVASVDHAYQLAPETMQRMKERQIYAVPTFAISEYFIEHAASPEGKAAEAALQRLHAAEFRKQLAAGVPMAAGSDVGPFPHGTQGRELELMVQYGMPAADVLRADLLHGARLLGWEGQIGELKAGFYADILAVDGNPLEDMAAVRRVAFVMKGGAAVRGPVPAIAMKNAGG